MSVDSTYLDRTKYPENQCLYDDQCRRADAKCEVNAKVFAYLRVFTRIFVHFRPMLQPYRTTYLAVSIFSQYHPVFAETHQLEPFERIAEQ